MRISKLEEEFSNFKTRQKEEVKKTSAPKDPKISSYEATNTAFRPTLQSGKPFESVRNENGVVVQGIQRTKSTCYINAAIQALFTIQEFTQFIKENRFDRNNHPLLHKLQRLHHHCRQNPPQISTKQYTSNQELINCLNQKKKMNIDSKKQEDSIEFFEKIIKEIQKEMMIKVAGITWKKKPDILNLLQTNLFEIIRCQRCRNERVVDYSHITLRLENNLIEQTNTINQTLQELLLARNRTSLCPTCSREDTSSSTFSYEFSKYLCIKLPRNIWNNKNSKTERVLQKIRPDESLDIETESQSKKTHYNLMGGIVHEGGANYGHYINIINTCNNWYRIDDDNVTKILKEDAIQNLADNGVLIIYQEEQGLTEKKGVEKKNDTPKTDSVRDSSASKIKPDEDNFSHNKLNHNKNDSTPNNKLTYSNDLQSRSFFQPSDKKKRHKPKKKWWKKIYIKKADANTHNNSPENSFNGQRVRNKRGIWKKKYIRKQEKRYYDADKNCYYIPRT